MDRQGPDEAPGEDPQVNEAQIAANRVNLQLQLWDRIEALEGLVRWLARTYGDNEPIFATELPPWMGGGVLEDGLRNQALYRELMGEGIPTGGAAFQCDQCGTWQVRSPEIETAGRA